MRCRPSSIATTSYGQSRTMSLEGPPSRSPTPAPIETDPAIVAELIEHNQASIAAANARSRRKSGAALLDFILADLQELKRLLFDPAKPSGDHGGHRGHLVAQRATTGVAGRKERGRHAHAVRPQQRHVGDGAGAAGRCGRDPTASGGGGVSGGGGGRELSERVAQAHGRARGTRRHPVLARPVRDALRRRDRHHEAALERAPEHAPAHDPRQRQELRAWRRHERRFEQGRAGGLEERSRRCSSACRDCRMGEEWPTRPGG